MHHFRTNLVVHNELGVFVEDWILPSSERFEIFQQSLRMDVIWGPFLDAVRLTDHRVDVNGITMVEEILWEKMAII